MGQKTNPGLRRNAYLRRKAMLLAILAMTGILAGFVLSSTVEQPKLAADQQRELLTGRILAHPDGPETAQRILERFNALVDA